MLSFNISLVNSKQITYIVSIPESIHLLHQVGEEDTRYSAEDQHLLG